MKVLVMSILFFILAPMVFCQDTIIRTVNIYTSFHDSIFAKEWYEDGKFKSTPLLEDQAERSIEIASRALSKYPVELLDSNLENICFFRHMYLYNTRSGGTYWIPNKSLLITNRSESVGYTNEFVEKLIHAEFSSLLFHRFRNEFPLEAWEKINESDTAYLGDAFEAIRTRKNSEKIDTVLLEKGFLSQYGMSTLENDYNSVAKNIFMGGEKFWEIVNKYEKIEQKVKLFIEFYHKIHPVFTRKYFEEIDQTY